MFPGLCGLAETQSPLRACDLGTGQFPPSYPFFSHLPLQLPLQLHFHCTIYCMCCFNTRNSKNRTMEPGSADEIVLESFTDDKRTPVPESIASEVLEASQISKNWTELAKERMVSFTGRKKRRATALLRWRKSEWKRRKKVFQSVAFEK